MAEEFNPETFLRDFLEWRSNKQATPEPEELKALRESQQHLEKQYPDAEYIHWDNEYTNKNKCPYCHKNIGDLDEVWDDLGFMNLPAIGTGRVHRSGDYYDGLDETTVDVYIRCPHCGKVFYMEY